VASGIISFERVTEMIHILIGLLMIVLGYMVKYRRWSWLIAGYNTSSAEEKDQYDTAALCSGVGNFLFILAALLFIAALGEYMDRAWIVSAAWIMFAAASVVFLVYANTGGRYRKEGGF